MSQADRSDIPPSPSGRTWRVGHRGRDMMYYEEWQDGAWARLDIDGEMLTGRAHHMIWFRSAEDWQNGPAWARDRRDEIIARIKSEFREPDYEYFGAAAPHPAPAATNAAPASPAAPPRPVSPPHAAAPAASARQRAALWLAIVLLLGIAGAMGWLVKNSLETDSTTLRVLRPSLRRPISRVDEPATFWLAVSLYAVIGLGTGGLALRGIREASRLGSSGR
jgi:hypothetical protein